MAAELTEAGCLEFESVDIFVVVWFLASLKCPLIQSDVTFSLFEWFALIIRNMCVQHASDMFSDGERQPSASNTQKRTAATASHVSKLSG